MKRLSVLCIALLLGFSTSAWAQVAAPAEEPQPEAEAEAAPLPAEEPQPEAEAEAAPQPAEETQPEVQAEAAPQPAEETQPEVQAEAAPQSAKEPKTQIFPKVAEEPEMDSATKTCYDSCDCWREFGGGEVILGMIFPDINSAWGEMSGTMMMVGGRGYGYFLDGHLRLGGMGMSMFKSDSSDQITQRYYRTATGRLPHISEERQATGGYGGLTLEYVFHLDRYVHFPIGTLVGFGGGSFDSRVRQSPGDGLEAISEDGSWMFVLQPMASINVSALSWLRLGVGFFYLWADPVDSEADFSSPGVMLSLGFGHFFEEPFTLKNKEEQPEGSGADDPLADLL